MKQKIAYMVLEDSVIDYDGTKREFLFDSLEKALTEKNRLIEDSGIRDEISDGWVCIDEEYYFEAYPEGEYCENHYVVYIKKLEIN